MRRSARDVFDDDQFWERYVDREEHRLQMFNEWVPEAIENERRERQEDLMLTLNRIESIDYRLAELQSEAENYDDFERPYSIAEARRRLTSIHRVPSFGGDTEWELRSELTKHRMAMRWSQILEDLEAEQAALLVDRDRQKEILHNQGSSLLDPTEAEIAFYEAFGRPFPGSERDVTLGNVIGPSGEGGRATRATFTLWHSEPFQQWLLDPDSEWKMEILKYALHEMPTLFM